MMLDKFYCNVCANCGEEIMMDLYEADFCDVECANEFYLMESKQKLEEE